MLWDECLREFMDHHDCTKDSAKAEYLAVLNGGKPTLNSTERFNTFVQGVSVIHDSIAEFEPQLMTLSAKESKVKQGERDYII